METLRVTGVPYTDEEIANAEADLEAQATGEGDTEAVTGRYPKAVIGPFTSGQAGHGGITEADAVIAYLQMLGTLVDFKDYKPELDYR